MSFFELLEQLILNGNIDVFIESTYIPLSDVSTLVTPEQSLFLRKQFETLLIKLEKSIEGIKHNYTCLIGMSGSGKSTLANIARKHGQSVISIDDIVEHIKIHNQNLLPPSNTPDDMKKFEYKIAVCMFISGQLKDHIFDFGGGTALQKGLIELLNVLGKPKIINLRIPDDARIANIAADIMYYGDASVKIPVKTSIAKDTRISRENIENLRMSFIKFCNKHGELESSKAKIRKFKSAEPDLKQYVSIYMEHAKKYDELSRWRLNNYRKIARETNFKESAKLLGFSI